MPKLIVRNRFGITPNDVLNDANLSLKAKGLFGYIQSKPDGWRFSAEKIESQTSDGIRSVKSGIKELENAGLLQRRKYRGEKGRWVWEYILLQNSPQVQNVPMEDNPPGVQNALVQNALVQNVPNISKKDTVKKSSKKESMEKQVSPFIWAEYLQQMDNDKRESIQLIAYYFKKRKLTFDSRAEVGVAIKRHLRAANQATKFSQKKVLSAIDECQQQHRDIGWTLETVVKTLTK